MPLKPPHLKKPGRDVVDEKEKVNSKDEEKSG